MQDLCGLAPLPLMQCLSVLMHSHSKPFQTLILCVKLPNSEAKFLYNTGLDFPCVSRKEHVPLFSPERWFPWKRDLGFGDQDQEISVDELIVGTRAEPPRILKGILFPYWIEPYLESFVFQEVPIATKFREWCICHQNETSRTSTRFLRNGTTAPQYILGSPAFPSLHSTKPNLTASILWTRSPNQEVSKSLVWCVSPIAKIYRNQLVQKQRASVTDNSSGILFQVHPPGRKQSMATVNT